MTSAIYTLVRDAMFAEKQVHCVYESYARVLCPVILGHSDGKEKLLAFQIGGTSSKGLPRGGEWKYLYLSKVRNPQMADGPWREGERHSQQQSCVKDVDIDINIHVRKRR